MWLMTMVRTVTCMYSRITVLLYYWSHAHAQLQWQRSILNSQSTLLVRKVYLCWCVLLWAPLQTSNFKSWFTHWETQHQVAVLVWLHGLPVDVILDLLATSLTVFTAGQDYSALFGTLSLSSATDRECVAVYILDDPIVEYTETLSIILISFDSKVNITSPSEAIISVLDNDGES